MKSNIENRRERPSDLEVRQPTACLPVRDRRSGDPQLAGQLRGAEAGCLAGFSDPHPHKAPGTRRSGQ